MIKCYAQEATSKILKIYSIKQTFMVPLMVVIKKAIYF